MAATPTPFSWTSLEGRTVIREIIEARIPQWTTEPRPAQLECWSHTLAGIPTILIALTGWGKTTAFFVPILVLQHLLKYPKPRIPQPPPHPVALVVTPLIELGNAHAIEITTFGIKAVSLTAETLTAASKEGQNLLKEISECRWDVVLLSAERLVSPDVDDILQNERFHENLILLGIDEAHVLVPCDFRKAYLQIPLLRCRLPAHTALIPVSVTISPGAEFNSLCEWLELKAGKYHIIQESSERPNIRMIFKELTHGLGGYQFPDIAWVFRRGVKAVVYCHTIDLGFRVGYYGWSLYPERSRHLDNVRLWTSITSAAYNNRTLDLFKSEVDTSVIMASIAFGMGMNLRNITDSINLGIPTTYAGLIQQNGRTGRDAGIEARGWTYVESSMCTTVAEDGDKGSTGNKRVDEMDSNLYEMVRAHVHGICLIATSNTCSGNPGEDSLFPCAQAKQCLFCSSCQPYPSPNIPSSDPLPPNPIPPNPVPLVFMVPNVDAIPSTSPLTKKVRAIFSAWLEGVAVEIWNSKDDPYASILPFPAFWHGISQDHILDNFHVLTTRTSLNRICANWKYLGSDGDGLYQLVQCLRQGLEEHTRKQKEERARKSAAMRAKNKGAIHLYLIVHNPN
ncbi:hypothetical protein M413DRAFT_75866 [Hebeloma cylindrosporum]|uniref:DNA 3'-5' helicase n=1 Tax=Hebeloma cylindrosporum TaxID=76867 RepID=A0A0C2XLD5_HEBCY|nr:hypothetical protein M413DRAFT_75866 [Hebeloma cylindrosporum h7]